MAKIELSEAAREARNAYRREYRRKNRERINAYQAEWRAANPEKCSEYEARHWEKVAGDLTAENRQ